MPRRRNNWPARSWRWTVRHPTGIAPGPASPPAGRSGSGAQTGAEAGSAAWPWGCGSRAGACGPKSRAAPPCRTSAPRCRPPAAIRPLALPGRSCRPGWRNVRPRGRRRRCSCRNSGRNPALLPRERRQRPNHRVPTPRPARQGVHGSGGRRGAVPGRPAPAPGHSMRPAAGRPSAGRYRQRPDRPAPRACPIPPARCRMSSAR